jgi:hypothetical protein
MHNGHVLYFISVGQGQQVPQLWQTDMPKGNNKKQVFKKMPKFSSISIELQIKIN